MAGRKKLSIEARTKREERRQRRAARRAAERQGSGGKLPSLLRENPKRRHHYVWRAYLEAWADSRGQIWCERQGKRFHPETKNVAVQSDFYRLKEMTDADLNWVERVVIGQMPDPEGRKLARGWIPMFRDVFKIRDLAKHQGVS